MKTTIYPRKNIHLLLAIFLGFSLLMIGISVGLAQSPEPYLVKDTDGDNTSPGWLTNVNGTLFYAIDDSANGYELWKSDGTETGTTLVKDINPGNSESNPEYLTEMNGLLFFVADDGNGPELWKSDGTEAGTALVRDISPNYYAWQNPRELTNVNGTLFFSVGDGTHGAELWKSDGTEAGTTLVKDINLTDSSFPVNLININGTLFFSADDGTNGYELWKSDGTPDGTVLVRNINPTDSSSLGILTSFNNMLFFIADDGTNGYELWKSDGTPDGTVLVRDINPTGSSSFGDFVSANDSLFFAVNDGSHGCELWKSDGTEAGTVLVKDIYPGNYSECPRNLTDVNGIIFFAACDQGDCDWYEDYGNNDYELWKSDGTETGTVRVKDINPGSEHGSNPNSMINMNGILFFAADNGIHGEELWQSDGTEAGTMMVTNINSSGSASPSNLVNIDGLLFFSANDGTNGYELWAYEVPPANSGETNIYLPLILKALIPPTAPTISNVRYSVDVNNCYINGYILGSQFDIYFDFTDPNGDVIYGTDSGPVDGYANIEFFPNYEAGILDFYDYYVYGYTTTSNDPTRGTINMDTLCVAFENNNSMRLTFTLQDQAGLESNRLPVTIPRPVGAVSAQGVRLSTVWSASE